MTQSKLRVLFIDHTAVLSGGELAMLEILRNIDRSVYECAVLLGSTGPLVAELQGVAPVFILPMSRRLLDTRKQTLRSFSFSTLLRVLTAIPYIWQTFRFIRRWKPDIVHTNSLKSDILAGLAARLAGTRLIWHIRDRIDPDYLPAKAVHGFRLLCRLIPNSVVGCSQAVLDTLHLPAHKPRTVVYSGVPLQPSIHSESSAVKTIGLIGRLAPWKGQHIFLAAAATLRESCPNLRIVLLGSAMFGEQDYEESLHTLVKTLQLEQIVEFRGFVRAIEREIQGLDIVVHASTTAEPFGQTIVQGMAAGKPVVATRGGGASEIIRDGVDGLLVNPNDASQLAAALQRLIADPAFAGDLAARGRRRVEEKFTIQHTLDALTSAFGTLAPVPTAPIRILFTNATGRVSGGEVVLLNILRNLPERDFRAAVTCPAGSLFTQMSEAGFDPIEMPELSLRFTQNPFRLFAYALSVLTTAWALRNIVRRTCPQVIHANSIRAGLITTLATSFLSVPVQWHVHDNLPRRALSVGIRIAAILSRRSTFVAVSRSTAANLAGSVLEAKLAKRTSVLLNAVDSAPLEADASARLKAEFSLSPDTFCIVHAAQIAPRKDQLGAVQAFALAFAGTQRARLLLVGAPVFDGNDRYLERVREEARALGVEQNVLFLGHRKDVRSLMQGADLVMLNSLNDPCPLTVLEAMAAGAPILASRVDGIPELIADGRTGWLSTPGDPLGFAEHLREIALQPPAARALIGEAARLWVLERPLSRYIEEFSGITRRALSDPEDLILSQPLIAHPIANLPGDLIG